MLDIVDDAEANVLDPEAPLDELLGAALVSMHGHWKEQCEWTDVNGLLPVWDCELDEVMEEEMSISTCATEALKNWNSRSYCLS